MFSALRSERLTLLFSIGLLLVPLNVFFRPTTTTTTSSLRLRLQLRRDPDPRGYTMFVYIIIAAVLCVLFVLERSRSRPFVSDDVAHFALDTRPYP